MTGNISITSTTVSYDFVLYYVRDSSKNFTVKCFFWWYTSVSSVLRVRGHFDFRLGSHYSSLARVVVEVVMEDAELPPGDFDGPTTAVFNVTSLMDAS